LVETKITNIIIGGKDNHGVPLEMNGIHSNKLKRKDGYNCFANSINSIYSLHCNRIFKREKIPIKKITQRKERLCFL
jgi:hypothetical protein